MRYLALATRSRQKLCQLEKCLDERKEEAFVALKQKGIMLPRALIRNVYNEENDINAKTRE